MQSFSERVLAWYHLHGRKQLPWQQQSSAYRTWVSEVMLQQTQVTTVIPYFNRFMQRFPDIQTLADADLDTVLSYWAGLGYYSRARNLHKAAQMIRDNHAACFPDDFTAVLALPGIGRSTAGAILSLAFEQRHAILDGNVKRVLSRHAMISGQPNQSATLKKQWTVAEKYTPAANCHWYTQAMMDLGAMVCTRTRPKCHDCPVSVDCQARLNEVIHEYPNKKIKKTLPEKSTTMLIITDGEKVLLEKRPETGIWGGLWSLPEVALSEINTFLQQQRLVEVSRLEKAVYTHVFTHYRLFITPIVIEVRGDFLGFTEEQRQTMGLPTPIQRILS